MKNKKVWIMIGIIILVVVLGYGGLRSYQFKTKYQEYESKLGKNHPKFVEEQPTGGKSAEEWKKLLTADQYKILREEGTEKNFKNAYWDNYDKGIYVTADCGEPVFSSEQKFKSGTGWPSFYAPINNDAVVLRTTDSAFGPRIKVYGAKCGGYLGEVFFDGPKPTGLRYCLDSLALKFKAASIQEGSVLFNYVNQII